MKEKNWIVWKRSENEKNSIMQTPLPAGSLTPLVKIHSQKHKFWLQQAFQAWLLHCAEPSGLNLKQKEAEQMMEISFLNNICIR